MILKPTRKKKMIDFEEFVQMFGGRWGEHPDYKVEEWAEDVKDGNTRFSYWEWVFNRCGHDVPKTYSESRVIPNGMTVDELVELLTIRCRTTSLTPEQSLRLIELECRFFGGDIVEQVIATMRVTSSTHIRESCINWLADNARKGLSK